MSVNLTENVLPVPFPWILSPYSVHCSSSHLRTVPGMHLHITALKTKEVSDLPAVHHLFIYSTGDVLLNSARASCWL